MIRKLKYSEIDFEKYRFCIENSVQKNHFANKENLDFLCENWEVLVYGDYDYVMPIPLKKKMGKNFVIMPLFCQQLGIFGSKDDVSVNQKFLNFLQNNYRVYFYSFNSFNRFETKLGYRKDYLLAKGDYEQIKKRFSKGRKSAIKSANSYSLDFKEVFFSPEIFDFVSENFKGLEKKKDMKKLLDYIKFLDFKKKIKIFGVFFENSLAGLAFVAITQEKNYLLGLGTLENLKKYNVSSFLVDKILELLISKKPFDFMGGNLRNIEIFFKSFGPELQEFAFLKSTKTELIKKFLNKL